MPSSSFLAAANNRFALAMFGHLAEPRENLFFSPLSLVTALAMTYAGARGETAAEMARVLGFEGGDSDHAALGAFLARLNAAGGDRYELALANSLWGQEGEPFVAEFLELVGRHYGGGMNLVDFQGAAEATRQAINGWVEVRTKEKIRDLIPQGGVDALTRLVLVNAVYFKGQWVLPFEKELTRDLPFYREGGGEVKVPLMHQQAEVRYTKADGFQVVDLDYEGDDLSMLVLLPDVKDGLSELEQKVSADLLRDYVARMWEQQVKLFLPRFKLTWGTAELSVHLEALGMPLAFNEDRADFSGINGQGPETGDSISISKVFHQAFVEVNEEGTEAAAATAVAIVAQGMPEMPPSIPIFRADHPFLFAIRDKKSGVILFLGRVIDPKSG